MVGEEMLQTVLEELRISNGGAWAVGDALDQKANFLFAGGSVVFGVIAALEAGQASQRGLCVWVILGLCVALYIAMTIVFGFVISPRKYRTALREDRGTIEHEVLERDSSVALLSLIEGYIETIAHNRGVNKKKSRGVKWSAGLLAALVTLLIVIGLIAQ